MEFKEIALKYTGIYKNTMDGEKRRKEKEKSC